MDVNKIASMVDKAAQEAWKKLEDDLERKRYNLKSQRKLFEKEKSQYTDKLKEAGKRINYLSTKLAEKNEKIKQQNKAVSNTMDKYSKVKDAIKKYLGEETWKKVEYHAKRL